MPSQLPTFSLDSQCCDTSAGGGGGGHGHLLLLPATGTQASSSLPPLKEQGQQEAINSTRMNEEEEEEEDDDFIPITNTSRITTSELFPGPGELAAVHAKLREELVHLKAHGQEGSYRYVMQEMALKVLERKEVEYIVLQTEEGGEEGKKRGRSGGRKRSSNTQQLGYALEELQRGVLAPVGLDSRRTRFLGLASDILADISLVVQGHGGD